MKLRRRAVLKWTGAGLCALIFGVWFATRWITFVVEHRAPGARLVASLFRGEVYFGLSDKGTVFDPSFPNGWSVRCEATDPALVGWNGPPVWWSNLQEFRILGIALYIPFAAAALLTALLFHGDRRAAQWKQAGRCANCGYDLSGLPPGGGAAACPECGKSPPS